ncbi:unnamed protein product [Cuscuta campestris]|uniref:Endonuclease/exonuclease/phosphatase domain-containing protein n=1 Tax=Cuscuta campestris TaxID=132261 RepID=A0A484NLE9_9ASTE|nr:unnamed protein product [Cuscuta campestris]
MKHSPPSFRRPASAAVAASVPFMYRLPQPGGGRGLGLRSYSDRPSGDEQGRPQVPGGYDYRPVQDPNRGFRPSYCPGGNLNFPPQQGPYRPPQPSFSHYPPPNLYSNQQFYRPLPPPINDQQFSRPVYPPPGGPPFYQNQQFRPTSPINEFRPRPRPPKALNFRVWEHAKTEPPSNCDRFTVLSYNILADYLATNHGRKLYFHIPLHIMDWESRKRSIVFELGLWSADVLCLQEVDRFQDLEAELQLRGYKGIWKMRTGDAVDGCAIFWRGSRLKLLQEDFIEFKQHGLRDNVAQICVFELLDPHACRSSTTSTTCSSNTNKVVICNIHVLFNPRRGEMKLGQIRLLLDRADQFSKLWNGAPVVICGDFNSTPKSPLYNFIAEQKLDISEVARDKVSGQESGTLYSPKPSPSVKRVPYSADFVKGFTVSHEGEGGERCSKLDVSTCSPEIASGDGFSRVSRCQAQNSIVNESGASIVGLHFEDKIHKSTEATIEDFHASHRSPSVPLSASKDSQYISRNEYSISSTFDEDRSKTIESRHGENSSSDAISNSHINILDPDTHSDLESICYKEEGSIGENHPRNENNDKNMEHLSLDRVFGGAADQSSGEDSEIFKSEICGASDIFSSESTDFQVSELKELDEQSKPSAVSHSEKSLQLGEDFLNDYRDADFQATYDPSAWTPMEIQTATGSVDCTIMEHPFKLSSVYRDVEDVTGTRDSIGEPEATSYHRCFLGTVDYIWRSEGLQTVRVLAPIPKQAMQWFRGFPTKKWGSDHIALVSELAFTGERYPAK